MKSTAEWSGNHLGLTEMAELLVDGQLLNSPSKTTDPIRFARDPAQAVKRFELSTLSLARRCSTTELHPQNRRDRIAVELNEIMWAADRPRQ